MSITVSILGPLVYLWLVEVFDRFRTVRLPLLIASLGWGAVAFALAFVINTSLIRCLDISETLLVGIVAPVIEEFLKSLLVLVLVNQGRVLYLVDTGVYGFASGLAFGAIETVSYTAASDDVALAGARVLSTVLMHGASTALIGIALGRLPVTRGGASGVGVVSGFTVALLRQAIVRRWVTAAFRGALFRHASFNELVSRPLGLLVLVLAVAFAFAMLVWTSYQLHEGVREERDWISGALQADGTVTAQDRRMATQPKPNWLPFLRSSDRVTCYGQALALYSLQRHLLEFSQLRGRKSSPRRLAQLEGLHQRVRSLRQIVPMGPQES